MRLSQAIREAKARGLTPVIAEVKARSPRDGELLRGRDPGGLARAMVEAGAVAVSVVTEPQFFGGSLRLLREVRGAVSVPVLRKDFVREEGQVRDGGREGADAILLISSILGREGLARLLSACASEGLEPLVEVHTTSEMGVANSLGAPLIGINNRDIRRLETDGGDVGNTEALARLAHPGAVLVSESSIATRGDVLRAIGAGADAVLVGTAVMRAEDPGEKVRELIGR